mmetsp:Transcript_1173/g.4961  ORF Transcript_1173/g.4961 Transcript_1173/m.4961 type:complete len:209 (+) Transcript_1173:595-1221(+)
MGSHRMDPSEFFDMIPGRISMRSPRRSTPCRMEPPATPPCSSSASIPGLLTSKERITMRRGTDRKSLLGSGTRCTRYSHSTSTLYRSTALMGMMGAASATVPATKRRICCCCAMASSCFTRSTLFCRMMMCSRRMISTAAKCSEVWGWGQGSLPAMRSSAASMTAAPLSMVAMRMSWPGQSTKLTWRWSSQTRPSSSKTSGWLEPLLR